MGYELVIVAVIMMFQGIIMLQLYQHGWEKRQKMKYNYQIKRAKMTKKIKAPVIEETTMATAAPSIVGMLSKLDPDTRQDLIDAFLGGGFAPDELPEETGERGGMDLLLDFAQKNPEVVQGLLSGLTKGKGVNETFPGQ